MTPPEPDPLSHCVAKVAEIVEAEAPDARALFQLGYNLGRFAELAGLGREAVWDRWKGPVVAWDRSSLRLLAQELHEFAD